jgi:hypothetical protein
MRPFMFLCPNTGYIVQGQADNAVTGEKLHTFHLVSCASCGRSHLVDPATAGLSVRLRCPLDGAIETRSGAERWSPHQREIAKSR